MELKQKTKNKKQKKVNGRKQFFAGIGVGLLFSAITLILIGMFASCSAKENLSLPTDEIQTIDNNNQVQKALTPPNDYDFGYYYSSPNGRFVAHNDFDFYDEVNIGDDYDVNDTSYLAFNSQGYTETSTYNHYHNTDKNYYISSELFFYKTPTLFGSLSASNTDAVPKENYIQLSPVNDAYFRIEINNTSPYDLKLYLDTSSSGRTLISYQTLLTNNNDTLAYYNTYQRYDTLYYSYVIPAFMNSQIKIWGDTSTALISFDAYYLTSLGLSASYSAGYDTGYADGYGNGIDTGYDTGYADGYDEGIDVGYADGYLDAIDDGYDTGYDIGYAQGLEDYAEGGVFPPLTMSFNLINSALGGVLDIFTIDVMPGISLLSLMLVPLTIALVVMVFRFLRG